MTLGIQFSAPGYFVRSGSFGLGAPVAGASTRVQALKPGNTYEVRVVPARSAAVSATRYTVVQRVRAG